MNIIVNADDFGINEVVTSEIQRLIEMGEVSSTTIMANGSCLAQVKRFALLHPTVSYGVHLCLSEYGSITKSNILERYGIIDENGCFIKKAIFSIGKYPDDLKMAIREELNAQISVVRGLGIPLSHCDSHHHVHTIKGLADVFKEVLDENSFTKIRLCSPFTSFREKVHIFRALKRRKINDFYKNNFSTADAFYSYSTFLNEVGLYDDRSTIELMCHPGHPVAKYKAEIDLLERNELKDKVNYNLISYNEL